jgi:hypothetical protein
MRFDVARGGLKMIKFPAILDLRLWQLKIWSKVINAFLKLDAMLMKMRRFVEGDQIHVFSAPPAHSSLEAKSAA